MALDPVFKGRLNNFLRVILYILLIGTVVLNSWQLSVFKSVQTTSPITTIDALFWTIITIPSIMVVLITVLTYQGKDWFNNIYMTIGITMALFVFLCSIYISIFASYAQLDISVKDTNYQKVYDFIFISLVVHIVLFIMYIIFIILNFVYFDAAAVKKRELKRLSALKYDLDVKLNACKNECVSKQESQRQKLKEGLKQYGQDEASPEFSDVFKTYQSKQTKKSESEKASQIQEEVAKLKQKEQAKKEKEATDAKNYKDFQDLFEKFQSKSNSIQSGDCDEDDSKSIDNLITSMQSIKGKLDVFDPLRQKLNIPTKPDITKCQKKGISKEDLKKVKQAKEESEKPMFL